MIPFPFEARRHNKNRTAGEQGALFFLQQVGVRGMDKEEVEYFRKAFDKRFVFLFEGGPLEGNGVHYDGAQLHLEVPTHVSDPGHKAFVATKGAQIGKRFSVLDPGAVAAAPSSTTRLNLHVYEIVRRDVEHEKKNGGERPVILVICTYVGPAGEQLVTGPL